EHMMSKAQVVREMAAHGFGFAGECDDLPWQHALAFTPTAGSNAVPNVRFAAEQVVRGFLRAAAGNDPRIVAAYLSPAMRAEPVPQLPADARLELRAGHDGELLGHLRDSQGATLAERRGEVVLRKDEPGRWHIAALREPTASRRPHGSHRAFVAMHTATGGGSVAQQIALVHELGFDGVAWGMAELDAARHACEAVGGDLLSAYVVLDLAADQQ